MVAIGVVSPEGEEIWGYDSHDQGVECGKSIFAIASITKTFVSSLLAILVKEGKVQLTDPIATYIPEVKDHSVGDITLLQLATHTSGMPRLPRNLMSTIQDKLNPYKDYHEQHLLSALQDPNLRMQKAGQFAYSNFGYGVLGYILSKVTNQPLSDALAHYITTPLGMRDTVMKLDEDQLSRRLPVYTENGKEVGHWEFDVLEGAGGLYSTVSDLLQYIRCNVGLIDHVLSEVFSMCHEVRYQDKLRIGLGWGIQERDGHIIHWHNGGTYGSTSYIGFHKESKTGVVVLTNNGTSTWSEIKARLTKTPPAVDHIGRTLLFEMLQHSSGVGAL